MSDIIKDLYDLNYSEEFANVGIQESTIDLDLSTSEYGSASVTGNVTDVGGGALVGVTIKLFDSLGKPFKHTSTDAEGNYIFTGLNSGNYSITAVKQNYVITAPSAFFIQSEQVLTHNFTITQEVSLNLCSVAGHIYKQSEDEKEMLNGAMVSLLNATTRETVATTTSVEDGEYLFYGVVAGNYIIKATKQGYSASSDVSITAVNGSIINTDIRLIVNPETNVGTISGIVKHNSNVVPQCFVGLYAVSGESEHKTETLIATTKTNNNGMYMFGDVATGNYKVKAKLNK